MQFHVPTFNVTSGPQRFNGRPYFLMLISRVMHGRYFMY